jgi:hypothetical protein
MRTRLAVAALLLAPAGSLAMGHDCGAEDLYFGCTETRRGAEVIAGCGVHAEGRFLQSVWRTLDLRSEELLQAAQAPADGIAQLRLPASQWFVIEGELRCADGHAIPYRFLGERVDGSRAARLRTHRYTPDRLADTGNWNPDTQLHFGEFRARSLQRLPLPD